MVSPGGKTDASAAQSAPHALAQASRRNVNPPRDRHVGFALSFT